jgi:hypothetical protein
MCDLGPGAGVVDIVLSQPQVLFRIVKMAESRLPAVEDSRFGLRGGVVGNWLVHVALAEQKSFGFVRVSFEFTTVVDFLSFRL